MIRLQFSYHLSIHFLIIFSLGFSLSATAPAAEPTRITIWGLWDTEGDRAAIAEFERLNPDIKVTVARVGSLGLVDPQKLLTAVAGGVPPHAIGNDGDEAASERLLEKTRGSHACLGLPGREPDTVFVRRPHAAGVGERRRGDAQPRCPARLLHARNSGRNTRT